MIRYVFFRKLSCADSVFGILCVRVTTLTLWRGLSEKWKQKKRWSFLLSILWFQLSHYSSFKIMGEHCLVETLLLFRFDRTLRSIQDWKFIIQLCYQQDILKIFSSVNYLVKTKLYPCFRYLGRQIWRPNSLRAQTSVSRATNAILLSTPCGSWETTSVHLKTPSKR